MREWRWETIRIETVPEGLAVTKRLGKFHGERRIKWGSKDDVTTVHPARGPCAECTLKYGAPTLCRIARVR